MTIRSPGRPFTFIAVLLIAMVIMSAPEWNFIAFSKSTSGVVSGLGTNGSFTIKFEVNGQKHVLIDRAPYNIPKLEQNEQVAVRYLFSDDGQLEKAYIYWFWTIFHNKILILLIACLPWYAFVWSMPATWKFRIGNNPDHGDNNDLLKRPIDNSRSIE